MYGAACVEIFQFLFIFIPSLIYLIGEANKIKIK